MKIPTSLKVGGHTYTVEVPYTFIERVDLIGQSCHSTLEIRVSPVNQSGETRARSQVEETFLHELLHCVDVTYNSHALNEETVTRLSEGLYQVLKDNGMFAEEVQSPSSQPYWADPSRVPQAPPVPF